MLTIFISHAWKDDALYQDFKALLDTELGNESWINLSIPQSEAIQLRGTDFLEHEQLLDRLEDELILVEAALRNPGLPDVYSRVVWDRDGNRREETTVGSLQREETRLQREICAIVGRLPREYRRPPEFDDRKNASEQIRLHPELSLSIRNRITKADIVFVLATPFCRFRRWVDFEIAACAGTRAKVVAVLAADSASLDIRLDCDAVVAWDRAEIRRVIATV